MAGLKQRALEAAMKAYQWLEHRLGLIKPLTEAAAHPTPANNASWWYVFGSAATVLPDPAGGDRDSARAGL